MAYQPFIPSISLPKQKASVSGKVFTAPISSRFVLAVYCSVASIVAASTLTLQINWTEDGLQRSRMLNTLGSNFLSLASISNTMDNYLQVKADAGTNVTYSATLVGLGSYNLYIDYKIYNT